MELNHDSEPLAQDSVRHQFKHDMEDERLLFRFLAPSDIRFTQETISPYFRDGASLAETVKKLARIPDQEMEMLLRARVVEHADRFYVLDNRRLAVFRMLEMLGMAKVVKAVLIPKDAKEWKRKFNTTSGGKVVYIRGPVVVYPWSWEREGSLSTCEFGTVGTSPAKTTYPLPNLGDYDFIQPISHHNN